MGKKGKVGKQRKDNYYKLAKEKGFRSRAAFKLIQLNRKFQFLENSRVCIDLCAAPGGWLQIASQYMPVSSVILGIDLVPITPIRNVMTFQADITSEDCSKRIESTIAGWKADIVLHDGAPNVGKNWLHDAYSQNVLVVNALKLACTHLTKGGWFITKIFRSSDYNSLIWVFRKLFAKVHATKPQASRQESAEIFVICQNYKQPAEIDPKFFDPTALFADISDFDDTLKKQKADLLKPANKIKKTKAHGYEEGDALKVVNDVEFVTSTHHMDYLAQCHEIKLLNNEILDHKSTDVEIKECCKDLKVLGRKELLKLLKWRRTVRKDLTAKLMEASEKQSVTFDGDHEVDVDQMTIASEDRDDSLPDMDLDDFEAMQDEEKRKEAKRLKRREEKRTKDYQQRVNYGMVNHGDVLIEEENDLFSLKRVDNREVKQLDDVEPEELVEEPVNPDDITIKKMNRKKSVTFSRETDVQYFEIDGDYDEDSNQDTHEPVKEVEDKLEVPKKILRNSSDVLSRLSNSHSASGLLTDLMDVNQAKRAAASRFFDQETFGNIDLVQEFESDLVEQITATRKPQNKSTQIYDTHPDEETDSDHSDDVDDIDEKASNESTNDSDCEEVSKKRKQIKLDPEGLAIASMMVSSKKNREVIESEGWNRYAHADSHLAPKWFREEEAKHYRRNIPVTPELVKEYKQRLHEIDAKPIKKVLQAKVRKKRRAMRKMERVKKKVEAITSNDDMTQKDKLNQIRTVYKNATKMKKKEIKLVVGRKGLPTTKPGKSKYKMVDPRMRKDLRAKQKRDSKGSKSKKGVWKKTTKNSRRPAPANRNQSSNRGSQKMKSSKSRSRKKS